MVRILAARDDADLTYIADLADRLAENYIPSRPVHSVSSDAPTEFMVKISERLTAMKKTLHSLLVLILFLPSSANFDYQHLVVILLPILMMMWRCLN